MAAIRVNPPSHPIRFIDTGPAKALLHDYRAMRRAPLLINLGDIPVKTRVVLGEREARFDD
jgi:hypothetical protein